MNKAGITGYPQEPGADHERPSPTREEIREQLNHILESPVFQGSKRCKQFLEYVCDKSLSGAAETLKERTIAVEVFGRHPSSDLGEDTIVRVGAREVRKRLAQYYVTPEGLAARVHIDVLPGSYAPEFRYASQAEEAELMETREPILAAPPVVPAVPLADSPRQAASARSWLRPLVGVAVLAAVVAVAWAKLAGSSDDAVFRKFWEPVFRSQDPLLVAMAHPIVYHPSARAWRLNAELQTGQTVRDQRPIEVPPEKLDGRDMVAVRDQYVGFGDMVVATELAAMLSKRGKTMRVRPASGVQFADLRQAQTLLIGAITNHWTMELAQNWRFQFVHNPGHDTFITDTMDARDGKLVAPEQRRQWAVPSQPDASIREDYTMMCRIRNSITGGFVLVAAGIKQFGTEAAGRVLADPAQLRSVMSRIPGGWEERNLQIIFRTRVIGNTPAPPEVVAWYVW